MRQKPVEANLPGSGLLVVDDYFPNLLTGFRVAEFTHYLRVFPGMQIASTAPDFAALHAAYAERHADVAAQVVPWSPDSFRSARAVSLTFLNNAHHWVDELDRHSVPFVFTLYPGGGFELGEARSMAKLKRVLASPMLRSVVATQPVTVETLRPLCRVPVLELPGLVISPAYLAADAVRRPPAAGEGLRICFAAYRYDAGGRSKGYPEFIAVASELARRRSDLRFAVAGNFSASDWPIPEHLAPRLSFVGPLPTQELRQFFLGQDVMVAPTMRFALTGTEFDGFPTGSCVEASLCGVAIICSDELEQNRHYEDGREIMICKPEAASIIGPLEALARNPDRATQIGKRGQQRTGTLYGIAAQLLPRTRLLRSLADNVGIRL